MKKHVNCITINTDASYNLQHGVGAYAFYIVCDNFRIMVGGKLKNCKSSVDAEMMAIGNALHTLGKHPQLPTTKLIVINTDCTGAMERIKLKSHNEVGRNVARVLRQLRQKTSWRNAIMPKYEFRHVKAHNGIPDSRSFANDWCDKEAKKWIRVAVNEKLGEEKNK